MSTLLQAAKAYINEHDAPKDRITYPERHQELLENLRAAIAQASARWSDEEIEDMSHEWANTQPPWPGPAERTNARMDFIAGFRHAHALLSGEGEERPIAYLERGTLNSAEPADFEREKALRPDDYAHWFPVFATPPTSQVDQGVTMSREPIAYAKSGPLTHDDFWVPEYKGELNPYFPVALYAAPSTREKELEEALRAIEKMPHCQTAKTVDQCPGCVARKALESLNTPSDGK